MLTYYPFLIEAVIELQIVANKIQAKSFIEHTDAKIKDIKIAKGF